MRLRSLLFVPGDRPDRMEKATAAGADAVILDLEDSVSPDARGGARTHIAAFLSRPARGNRLFVRINALDGAEAELDLDAIAHGAPDGIVLPKASGAASVERLARMMVTRGLCVPILPIALETPAAFFQLTDYPRVADRLCGLTWGIEDLASAIGAVVSRDDDGSCTAPYELARSCLLFGARAAGVQAFETVYAAFRDLDGLARCAARAARDGFDGMMAIHPAQVEVINRAFTPSDRAIAQARDVVEAFAAAPGAGAVQLDGTMIDAPHLSRARRILESVGDLPA